MSDLRLEDLVVPNPNIEGDYYPVSRAEVLQAALTEDCEMCDGGKVMSEADDDGVADWLPCDNCDGQGRMLAAGVGTVSAGTYLSGEDDFLLVPLSMLEGDDT